MLHELLLALLGYTGDLIIEERDHHKSSLAPDSGDVPFKLAPDISFIEPSDRSQKLSKPQFLKTNSVSDALIFDVCFPVVAGSLLRGLLPWGFTTGSSIASRPSLVI